MPAQWTLGRTLAVGFGLAAVVVLFVGITWYLSVYRLIEAGRKVSQMHQVRRDLSELQARLTDAETGQRGYVITGDERFLAPYVTGLEQVKLLTAQLRVLMADTPEQIGALDRVDVHIEAKLAELKQTVEMRRKDGFDPAAKVVSDGAGKKIMDEIRVLIADMDRQEQALLHARSAEAELVARQTKIVIVGVSGVGLLVVAVVGWYTTSSLGRQIGSVAQRIQNSSNELQMAVRQQSAVSREQVASVSAIAATVGELAATSHRIADRAQQVSELVDQTMRSARAGDQTLQGAPEAAAADIRGCVDLIVRLLETATEAAKDIKLSTTRQTTVVEQMNGAITGAIRSARESESGSAQVLRTTTELTEFSGSLSRLLGHEAGSRRIDPRAD